jgi:hypothetical protein
MKIFRVSFIKNKILSVRTADNSVHFDGNIYYRHDKGQLLYAMIKANSEEEAKTIASSITQNVQTDDYIH